jgi:hypothetical protein
MANIRKIHRKFSQYNTDMVLYELERAGWAYTVDSIFTGAGYASKQNSVAFIAGKNGMFSIDLNNVDDFIEELKGVKELLEARKQAGIH